MRNFLHSTDDRALLELQSKIEDLNGSLVSPESDADHLEPCVYARDLGKGDRHTSKKVEGKTELDALDCLHKPRINSITKTYVQAEFKAQIKELPFTCSSSETKP